MPETGLLNLAKLYLFFPKQGAKAARAQENLKPSLWLYAAFLLVSMVFYWLKPWDFPDSNAPFPREVMGLVFWIKVMIWQPPLEIAWVLFLLGLSRWMSVGTFVFKLVCAVAWTILPFGLIVYYAHEPTFPRWAFAALSVLWIAPFYPLLRKTPAELWRPALAFFLGTNVIGLVLVAPMALAVWLGQTDLYYAAQIAGGFWILAVTSVGLKELYPLRLPRAFMAVLLSLFLQIGLAFTLHMLGLVPARMLKALLYS